MTKQKVAFEVNYHWICWKNDWSKLNHLNWNIHCELTLLQFIMLFFFSRNTTVLQTLLQSCSYDTSAAGQLHDNASEQLTLSSLLGWIQSAHITPRLQSISRVVVALTLSSEQKASVCQVKIDLFFTEELDSRVSESFITLHC